MSQATESRVTPAEAGIGNRERLVVIAILDVTSGTSTPVDLGNLNGGIDPYAPFFVRLGA